jgi:hypothetical protein
MAPFLSAFVRSSECFSELGRHDAEHIEEQMARHHRSD